jgi:hypothetical protein
MGLIKDNVINNYSDSTCIGIQIDRNIVSVIGNIINTKKTTEQSENNTFAIRIFNNSEYCFISQNYLIGVTRGIPQGAAFTITGNSPASLPGTLLSMEPLGRDGAIGFNIV